ncbi:MAG: hypothetical protein D6785_05475, partial [Planctomycetota bacterium]
FLDILHVICTLADHKNVLNRIEISRFLEEELLKRGVAPIPYRLRRPLKLPLKTFMIPVFGRFGTLFSKRVLKI